MGLDWLDVVWRLEKRFGFKWDRKVAQEFAFERMNEEGRRFRGTVGFAIDACQHVLSVQQEDPNWSGPRWTREQIAQGVKEDLIAVLDLSQTPSELDESLDLQKDLGMD